jgi:hypothetical protein
MTTTNNTIDVMADIMKINFKPTLSIISFHTIDIIVNKKACNIDAK